jgi:hypothetical protein
VSFLSQRLVPVALLVPLTASIVVISSSVSSPVNAAVTKASAATCSHLTKPQVQALLDSPITSEKVTTDRVTIIGGSVNGQRCTFAIAGTSTAMVVVVLKGNAKAVYNGDAVGFEGASKVPGVGTKAVRPSGTADEVISLKGNVYCSVTMSDNGDIPGIAQRMQAAGDTSDIGDRVYAAIALAMGTLCNRVFGSGNVTPNLHFPPSPATTTTTDGLAP